MRSVRTSSRQLGRVQLQWSSSRTIQRNLVRWVTRELHVSASPIQPFLSRRTNVFQLSQRGFSSSDTPNPAQSFSDPSRPDLFYHVVQAPTPMSETLPAYALSFSSEKPPSSSSATILGWLPTQDKPSTRANTTSTARTSNEGDATLGDFVQNSKFVDILHSAIKDGLREGVDEIQKATAMQTMEGWMHIHDQRNIPALNRIGNPDDIIGTVLVDNSEILPQTYQPMPAYRLITSDGVMQLTSGLAQKLQDTLAEIAEEEKASQS
ncbi:hypothetical protein AN958_10734 [Leucoagaricus sp. SymC.cos]|nr:hypothetical protein AN958_10734 [Leucoagaricus sp. SymC.cos]